MESTVVVSREEEEDEKDEDGGLDVAKIRPDRIDDLPKEVSLLLLIRIKKGKLLFYFLLGKDWFQLFRGKSQSLAQLPIAFSVLLYLFSRM